MFKFNNKDARPTLLALLKLFTSISVVEFEQVNVCWVKITKFVLLFVLSSGL